MIKRTDGLPQKCPVCQLTGMMSKANEMLKGFKSEPKAESGLMVTRTLNNPQPSKGKPTNARKK